MDDEELIVFAEELRIDNPKGCLVELKVQKDTYKLIDRHVLFDIPSHLSYPAYIKMIVKYRCI